MAKKKKHAKKAEVKGETGSEVTSINSGRNDSAEDQKKRSSKPLGAAIETKLIGFLEGRVKYLQYWDQSVSSPSEFLPDIEWNIWFYRKESIPQCYEIDWQTRTVVPINLDTLTNILRKIVAENFEHPDSSHPQNYYLLSIAQCKQMAASMFAYGRELDVKPKPVALLSDPELCFSRMPWDLPPRAVVEDFPTIMTNVKAMNNPGAFFIFIADIFKQMPDKKKVLYLHGPGDGGKSKLLYIAERYVGGDMFVGEIDEHIDKNFNSYELLNKGMIKGPECDPKFFSTLFFKRITGERSILCRVKYSNISIKIGINSPMIFFSNEIPAISNDSANRSRFRFCHVKSIAVEKRETPEKVYALYENELAAFARYCIDFEANLSAKDKKTIDATSDEMFESIVDENDSTYAFYFNKYWRHNEKKSRNHPQVMTIHAFEEQWNYMAKRESGNVNFRQVLKKEFKKYIAESILKTSGRITVTASRQLEYGGQKTRTAVPYIEAKKPKEIDHESRWEISHMIK